MQLAYIDAYTHLDQFRGTGEVRDVADADRGQSRHPQRAG
jgi:hypothetical protein